MPHSPVDRAYVALTAHNVARHLRKARGEDVRVHAQRDDLGMMPRDCRIVRHGNLITVSYDLAAPLAVIGGAQHFMRTYAYWLSCCPPDVTTLTVTGADGDHPSLARFTPSTRSSAQIAIPDPYFFHNRGFEMQRRQGLDGASWSERSEDLTWRGGCNSSLRISFDAADAMDTTVAQRLRLVMLGKTIGVDAQLTDIQQDRGSYASIARRLGFLGEPVPERSWLGRKYALDVDGTVNTWANFFVRLLYGCLVFKVQSQLGFSQWYYDRLQPWVHFVPIKADMSDLAEKWDWARRHDDEARAIAAQGQAFARELTFDQARKDAVNLISRHWHETGTQQA